MRNLFTHPAPPHSLPLIAPSVLSADFGAMAADVGHALDHGADLLHLDVMDGHFVPNLTMGPDLCRGLRRHLPNAFLDVHLMVTDPEKFIQPFADAGANHLTFHIEVIPPERVIEVAGKIREAGMTAGLAINPPTPVERVMPHLLAVDLILVMSVNPGYSGQAFIRDVLPKTSQISEELIPTQRLQMDGGINVITAPEVRKAGCDVLVAATAIFGKPKNERPKIISLLKN